ncbi:MAG: hypothetical protein WD069_10730 [Planctomycetales bacterium]
MHDSMRPRAGVPATYSVALGAIAMATSLAYFFLRRWMETLPFGDNDFDLVLFAIMIGSVGLLAVAFASALFGSILGIIGLFLDPRRSVAGVGTLLNAMSLALLVVPMWGP